ncbi:MAG: hypothetical protein RL325_493 [Planctomycetota bacterium]
MPEPTRHDPNPSQPRESAALRAPHGPNAIAFGALFAVSVAFLFASYCLARALVGGFGAGAGAIALCLAATAAASIFLWWLVPFADFAEIVWVHLPADRRARLGQCPHCGYPHAGRARCTECGASTAPLPAWTLSARPVRRLAWIVAPALLLGALAGESWCRLDESRFAADYAAARAPISRQRAFPATFARMWVDESGEFHSEAWPEFARDRGWQPKDPEARERGWGWRER